MKSHPKHPIFLDSNGVPIPYDGSPLTWRVSAYSIIVNDHQVLLVRGPQEKMYDLPGGGIEIGDSVIDTLIREALEEAGAAIIVQKIFSYHQDYFYHRHKRQFFQTLLLFFKARLDSNLIPPLSANFEAIWVKIDQLSSYPMLDYVRAVILKSSSTPTPFLTDEKHH